MNSGDKTAFLKQIDEEINTLYDFYLKQGLTPEQIKQKASPLLNPIKMDNFKRKIWTLILFVFCVISSGLLLSDDHIMRTCSMYGRFLLFKILPWWDWQNIYDKSCLLSNPYQQTTNLLDADTFCQVCEDFTDIERLQDTTENEVAERYLQNDIPVIVSDATKDWKIMEDTFTLKNLTDGYLLDLSLKDFSVCSFKTNLRIIDHRTLLDRLLSGKLTTNWYVHWENCDAATNKFLRKFYSRPYFIPSSAEMTGSNWLFISHYFQGKSFKLVDPEASSSIMWIAQLHGYLHFILQPKPPCNDICSNLENILEEGEILVFSPQLWDLSYLPGEDTETLAIANEGIYK